MIKSANCLCFADLLCPQSDEDKVYLIPIYQRPYAWTQSNCDVLCDDIQDADLGYYVGSIISVVQGDEKNNTIIDGQQRLTTLSLLLIAIYEKISAPGYLVTDEDISERVSLKKMLVTKEDKPKLVLQLEQNNREDYEFLVMTHVVKKYKPVKPNNFGNRRIGTNFRLVKELIDEMSKEGVLDLLSRIKKLTFVSIEVEDYQFAYQLFEAMNHRGLALTPVDLIKNIFISKSGKGEEWMKLVDLLGDDPRDQDQFFRYNYNAFRAEYNHADLSKTPIRYGIGAKATKSNVIKIYEQIIKMGPDAFISDIINKARIYNLMLGLSGDSGDKEFYEKFKEFRNAKATGAFILLMYLYHYQSVWSMTDDDLLELFDKILIFFIRRNLTNNPSTGSIPGILMDIIEKINLLPPEDKNRDGIFKIVLDGLRSKSSADEIVKNVLEGDMYLDNRDMVRFLLCRYEESFPESKERKINLWSIEKNKYVWTIEHVFPEGENIPQEWIDMIAGGDADLAKQYLAQYCHKIGNLTMSGYNSDLSNFSFVRKKELTEGNERKGYNNGLHLNSYIYSQSEWTVEQIKERTKFLVKEIMESLVL